MRHATSEMNESLAATHKEKSYQGYFDIALDPNLKDAELS